MKPWEDPYCQRCGSREIAQVIYGTVTSDVKAEYPDRRIILGGCVVEATSPKWQCLKRGNTWGRAFPDGTSGE